jgi:hypothetical protein
MVLLCIVNESAAAPFTSHDNVCNCAEPNQHTLDLLHLILTVQDHIPSTAEEDDLR